MINVTISISDDLYEQFRTLNLDFESILSLSVKLHKAIIMALLPKGGAQ